MGHQDRREPRGLRIVQEHDVLRLDPLDQLARVRLGRRLVDRTRAIAQRPSIAGGAVERVVDPLGELEERGVSADHQPACVDAGPAGVAEEWLEHLGDAPAHGGAVDVPDDPVAEEVSKLGRRLEERLHRIGADEGLEATEVPGPELDLGDELGRRRV